MYKKILISNMNNLSNLNGTSNLSKRRFMKILIFISALVIIFITLFASLIFLPSIAPIFDFSQSSKSSVATVIANLAAPILAIISSVLLYLALVKQTESNRFQVDKNELDMCFTLYNQLNTEYNNITLKLSGTRGKERYLEIYHGHQALVESLDLIRITADEFAINFETDKFMSLVSTFELTKLAVENTQLNDSLKIMFYKKLDKFYLYKLRSVFVLTWYLIKDNKDQISKDFINFVSKQELQINNKFDINAFSNETEVFQSNLNSAM